MNDLVPKTLSRSSTLKSTFKIVHFERRLCWCLCDGLHENDEIFHLSFRVNNFLLTFYEKSPSDKNLKKNNSRHFKKLWNESSHVQVEDARNSRIHPSGIFWSMITHDKSPPTVWSDDTVLHKWVYPSTNRNFSNKKFDNFIVLFFKSRKHLLRRGLYQL